GADFVVFEPRVARSFGVSPPFSRRVQISTAGGGAAFPLPRDRRFSLFLAGFLEVFLLCGPAVPFRAGAVTKNVLGLTGLLQYFSWKVLNDGSSRPELELDAIPSFPGEQGFLPIQPLEEFFRHLRGDR